MSDTVHFKVTLDITAQSEDAVSDFAAEHLRARGYYVVAPHETWESLGEFMRRIGVSNHGSVRRSLQHWLDRGEPLPIHRSGGKGRIQEILSNPDFDAFCLRNKK